MKTIVNLTWDQKVLYYMAKLFGLSPFTVKNNEIRPLTFLGKAYNLTLFAALLSCFCFYGRDESSGSNTDSSVNLVALILVSFFVASMASAMYIFAFKSEKMIEVINRISAAEEDLRTLGMENRQRRNLKIIATNVFVLAMKGIEFSNHPSIPKEHIVISDRIYWITLIALLVHNTNMILIFVHAMARIGRCFESLNEKLWDIPKRDHAKLSSNNRFTAVGHQDSTDACVSMEGLIKMRQLHHELSSLVNSTTDLFATPITLIIGYFFSCSLFYCYTLYRSVSSLESLPIGTTIFDSLLGTLIPAAIVVVLESMLIAHACSSTCDAGNATALKVHEVWNKFQPQAPRNELFMFSVQQLHNPITATAFGFFDLGYSYVREIFCTVVAYFVIMIQMNTSIPKNNSARE